MYLLPPEPWHRLLDETAEEYLEFERWLMSEPRPIPVNQALATRRDWAGRALAWDQMRRVSNDPAALDRELCLLARQGAVLEMRKLVQTIASARVSKLGPRDIVLLGQFARDHLQEIEAGGSEWDLTKLSQHDLDELKRMAKEAKG